MSHFMKLKDFRKANPRYRGAVYTAYKRDLNNGRTDRFKELDGVVYVDINYPLSKKQKESIERIEELYYKLVDGYKNESRLAVDLARFCDLSDRAIYWRLQRFSFKRKTGELLRAFECLCREKGLI